jgi:hypothetical protein
MYSLRCFLALFIAVIAAHDDVTSVVTRPRQPAPTFIAKAVSDGQFVDVNLAEYGRKGMWTVLLFYPFDFTFVCPTEIISFSDKNNEFQAIQTQVLAISTGKQTTNYIYFYFLIRFRVNNTL